MTSYLRTVRNIFRRNRRIYYTFYENFRNITAKVMTNKRNFRSLSTLLHCIAVGAFLQPKKRYQMVNKMKDDMILDANHILNAAKVRWMELMEIPGMFAYQLQESRERRTLPGKHGFYVELNADRSLKRRAPQNIESLSPTFNPTQFNFNKVNHLEVMLSVKDDKYNAGVHMIINKSPVTKFHTLVCPEMKSNLVQRLTRSGLSFCINFMRNVDDMDIRMGYNSPGALASVNHLHLHIVHMPQELYIDGVTLQELVSNYIFRLSPESPTQAICFVINRTDSDQVVRDKVRHLHNLTEWLCNNKLPHNLFITKERRGRNLRVFVFLRSTYCVNKDLNAFNIGFCEMVGYFPMANAEQLEDITETKVINRIKELTGNAYNSVYSQIKAIINESTDIH